MPKVTKSVKDHVIQSWIRDSHQPPELFEIVKNNQLFCKPCGKVLKCEQKSHIAQHCAATTHKERSEKPLRQTLITSIPSIKNRDDAKIFAMDLCEALTAANIPWYKINCEKFKDFLYKYTGKNIPDESTLRKNYLPQQYTKVLETIRRKIGKNDIWISVDETTDPLGRYLANLIVGKLDFEEFGRPYLLVCKELERTNSNTIARFINESLILLWPSGIQYEKVKLLVTDGAPYMIKAGVNLKVFYKNMIHITCLAHAINLLCEIIRHEYVEINDLISNVKKIFLKAPLRIETYREKLKGVPLPPEPVITRWGTWLEAAIFYADHYEEIREVVVSFESQNVQSIEKAQAIFKKQTAKSELFFIKVHFTKLIKSIKKLEENGLPLTESVEVVETLLNDLKKIPGKIGKKIYDKFSNLLSKNPGFSQMKQISVLFSSNKKTDNVKIDIDCVNFKFAPITSCDTERSFSRLKNILHENRLSFTIENLEKYLICNAYVDK